MQTPLQADNNGLYMWNYFLLCSASFLFADTYWLRFQARLGN